MNSSRTNQRGIAMLELIVALTIGIIAAVGFTKGLIIHLDQKRTEVTAGQMQTILDAATSYLSDKREWPDQGNSCKNAISVLHDKGYIAGVTEKTPWYAVGDGSVGDLSTFCGSLNGSNYTGPPPLFNVSVRLSQSRWASNLANSLSSAALDGNKVTSYAARTQVLAAQSDFIFKKMTYINNDDKRVEKPDCPDNYSPEIYGVPAGFSDGAVGPPVSGVFLKVQSQNSTSWYVHMRVTDEKGSGLPSGDYTPILAITACTANNT